MKVRTRFAPSPTGLLHVGNARVALFNYLFAKHHGGEFVLRIEDTDRERSTQEAVDVIFDGLKWMGLDWDNEPVFQSDRQDRYLEVVQYLLDNDLAYKCYSTPEELIKMREKARAENRTPKYDGTWRDKDSSHMPKDAPYVVRLKTRQEGGQGSRDLIRGVVLVDNSELDDFVLLRSDGTPTYNLAVVVDDHDMGITHVIRGEDHLTNSFRQRMIYQFLGWSAPYQAHLPLIHGSDGGKLSKRHGAQSVVDFRDKGILPEALCNYILRLGWGHGDSEILDRVDQIKLFDLDGVGSSPSRMDYTKLDNFNSVWMRKADNARLTDLVMERINSDYAVRNRILTLMPGLKERAKNIVELADNASFVGKDFPLTFTPKAKNLIENGKVILKDMKRIFSDMDQFTLETIDSAIREYASTNGLKMGMVAQPLRAAMTGTTTSPGIDLTLFALGKDEVIRRIDSVLKN